MEKSLSLQMKNECLNKYCNVKTFMTIQGGVTPQSPVINNTQLWSRVKSKALK